MEEVDPAVALEMLAAFDAACREAGARIKAVPALLRPFRHNPCADLKPALNNLVDYLSNSRDVAVVNYLNKYPFNITARNLGGVIDNTGRLVARIEGRKIETD